MKFPSGCTLRSLLPEAFYFILITVRIHRRWPLRLTGDINKPIPPSQTLTTLFLLTHNVHDPRMKFVHVTRWQKKLSWRQLFVSVQNETTGARYDDYLNAEITVHTFKHSESNIKALQNFSTPHFGQQVKWVWLRHCRTLERCVGKGPSDNHLCWGVMAA